MATKYKISIPIIIALLVSILTFSSTTAPNIVDKESTTALKNPLISVYSENIRIQQWKHYYTSVDNSSLNNVHGREFYTYPIVQSLLKNGIPMERAEIYAMLPEIESKWNIRAVSNKGAIGLWQIMGPTARRFHFKEIDMYDPVLATKCATQYLTYLDSLFSGDVAAVLFSYNGGESGVKSLAKKYKTDNVWMIAFSTQETHEFAPKVLGAWLCKKERQ
jgi:hypothetical protein